MIRNRQKMSGEELTNRVVNVAASILVLAALFSMVLLAGCSTPGLFIQAPGPSTNSLTLPAMP
jgi:hypothetical protein